MVQQNPFPPEYFQKQDTSDDARFYTMPRKVVHIDDDAIAALSAMFAEVLPQNGDYLDLMSSWRTHLPDGLHPLSVVGLGMNSEEMVDNPQLDSHSVQNLNLNPTLPYEDASFDAVLCTVSVQYLQQPFAVFTEVNRVLKPDAPFIVSFSNRCFPTKAVAVWLGSTDQQHMALVTSYFAQSGGWADIRAEDRTPKTEFLQRTDPLYVVWARKA